LLAESLDRLRRMHGLGRGHADRADDRGLAADLDDRRVAVHDADDAMVRPVPGLGHLGG